MSSVCRNNERMQNYGMPMCWSYGAFLLFCFYCPLLCVRLSLSLSASSDTEAALCTRWKPKAMWYEYFVPKYLLSAAWGILDCPLIFLRALVSHERKVEEIDVTNITPLWSKTNIWTLTQTVDKQFHALPAAPNFKYSQDTQRRFLRFSLCCSTRTNADLCLKAFGVRMMCLCSGSGNDLWLSFLGGCRVIWQSKQLGDEPKYLWRNTPTKIRLPWLIA